MKATAAAIGVCLLLMPPVSPAVSARQGTVASAPELSREQMRDFLLTARIIRSRAIGRGVTRPQRLTLTDGVVTHDAAFQGVNEHKMMTTLGGPGRPDRTELNFIDHYRYNLAAYALAGLVGLDDMMPVHVKRRWDGRDGSLSWWVDTAMDEAERLRRKIAPPNPAAWNEQMYRMRAFAALTRDTDRNLGNVLITRDWKVVMIDFTRAFRPQTELAYPQDLQKIDRRLLPRLEALTKDAIQEAVGDNLLNNEIDAVLKRRDVLVAHFRALIAERGEARVLY